MLEPLRLHVAGYLGCLMSLELHRAHKGLEVLVAGGSPPLRPAPHRPSTATSPRYNGCAIVDATGSVVTNVSVSDVRGLAAIAAAGGDVDSVLDEEAIG